MVLYKEVENGGEKKALTVNHMRKIQNLVTRFNRVTIKKQLYRIYTVVVAVPIILIGSFLLMYTHHMMGNYYKDLLKSDNDRVRNIMFDITREVYGISRDISFDAGVRNILSEEFESRQEYMRAVDRNEVLNRYAKNYAQISAIDIYTDNPYLSKYKQFICVDEETEKTVLIGAVGNGIHRVGEKALAE